MNNEDVNEALAFIEQKGLYLGQLLKAQNGKLSSLLALTELEKEKLNELIKAAKTAIGNDEKGKSLEELLKYLISYQGNMFDVKTNLRTSTNEIDLLVNWSCAAKSQKLDEAYDFIQDGIICECKNHKDNIGVTYIGKFISLVLSSQKNVGIFFSAKGVAGRDSWNDSNGLIRKVALAKQIYILDVSISDIEGIALGTDNFLNVIKNKYESLQNDVKYESYISKHDNEDKLL